MIGLDTNVLVRYLTQDDPVEAALATRLIEQDLSGENPGFVGLIVLVETTWVLQRPYRATPEEIAQTIADLLASSAVVVERRNVVSRALATAQQTGSSFADALIAACASDAGCERTVTFDRSAGRAGMTLLEPGAGH